MFHLRFNLHRTSTKFPADGATRARHDDGVQSRQKPGVAYIPGSPTYRDSINDEFHVVVKRDPRHTVCEGMDLSHDLAPKRQGWTPFEYRGLRISSAYTFCVSHAAPF